MYILAVRFLCRSLILSVLNFELYCLGSSCGEVVKTASPHFFLHITVVTKYCGKSCKTRKNKKIRILNVLVVISNYTFSTSLDMKIGDNFLLKQQLELGFYK